MAGISLLAEAAAVAQVRLAPDLPTLHQYAERVARDRLRPDQVR